MGGVKDQTMTPFKTNDYSTPESVKTAYGGGKKQSKANIIKISEIFFKKENESNKDNRDNKTLFKIEDDYYIPKPVGNFGNNYIEYESSGDRSKKLSVKEYLDKIKPYLRDIITILEKSDSWKSQLTIAITFISSKDADDESLTQ